MRATAWVQSMVGIMAFNQFKFLALRGKPFFYFQVLWHEHGLHVRSSFENFALPTLHLACYDPKEIGNVVKNLNIKFDKNGKKFKVAWKKAIKNLKQSGTVLYPETLKLVEIIFPLK